MCAKSLLAFFGKCSPNETSLVFAADDTCYCLLRRDQGSATAQLGMAKAPYTDWKWKDLGIRVGGPRMLQMADGRYFATVRLYKPAARTAVCAIDVKNGKLREVLPLPSEGDTSYAGMVEHEGEVWISYYSGHEGKTSIYLASVKLP